MAAAKTDVMCSGIRPDDDPCKLGSMKDHPEQSGGAVIIKNPNPDTTTNSFKFYLSNKKRSGGSKVVRIQRDENNAYLIAYYGSRDVAEQVAQRQHMLEDHKLDLSLWDPSKMHELPNTDDRSCVTPSVSLSSKPLLLPAATGECVTDAHGFRPETSEEPQSRLYPSLPTESEITEEIATQAVHEKKPTQTQKLVKGLHYVYLNILDTFSEVLSESLGVKIVIEDDVLQLSGEEHDIEKAEELVTALLQEQKSSNYIENVADRFNGWDEIFMEIGEKMSTGESKYNCVVREGAFGEEELYLSNDQSNLMSFDDFLENHVALVKIVVQPEAAELLHSTTWEEFKETELEETFGEAVEVFLCKDEPAGLLFVIGSVNCLDAAVDSVKQFLQNTPDRQCIQLKRKEKEFLQTFIFKDSKNLQQGTKYDSAELHLDGNNLNIEGSRIGVKREVNRVKTVCQNLKCKRAIVTHPNLGSLVHSTSRELWEEAISCVSKETRCLITELPDSDFPAADEDNSNWGQWNATVIESFALTDTRLLAHVVDGEVEELRVDAAVLFRGASSVNHSSQSGARPKTQPSSCEDRRLNQQTEGISISQSGARPCRALIHVTIPHYFQDGRSLEESFHSLMTDIFHFCEYHHLSSLAFPVLGVDVAVGRPPKPIDVVSKAIVQSIRHCHSRVRLDRQDKSCFQLFLCSRRAACQRGLVFALQQVPTRSLDVQNSFDFLSSAVPKTKGSCLVPGTIHIRPGDISRVQADILVVPMDIDIDLDLNKSQVTRSLLRGGPSVKSSLECRESRWVWTSEIEKRNEELAEQHVLVGNSGSLNSRNIFYVHLCPWGPGVAQVLTDRVRMCLQKASAKTAKTLAMTALGVGKLGYPPRFVARTTLSVVSEFMEQEKTSLESIQFVIFPSDRNTLEAFKEERLEWLRHRVSMSTDVMPPLVYPRSSFDASQDPSYASMASGGGVQRGGRGGQHGGRGHHGHSGHYSTQMAGRHPSHSSVSAKIGNVKLCVKIGNITSEKCDLVVNSINEDFNFSKGGIARTFEECCGRTLVAICKQKEKMKEMHKAGMVITAGPGLSHCDYILHLNLHHFKTNIRDTIKHCLAYVIHGKGKKHKFCSVAFPALGTGASHACRPDELVDHMVAAIKDIGKHKYLDEVRLVVPDIDLFQVLANHLTSQHSTGAQKHSSKRPATAIPRNVDKKQTTPAATVAGGPSSHAKGYNSDSTSENAVSLFIFSDSEENCDIATSEILSTVQEILGPAEVSTPSEREAAAGESNRRDSPRDGAAQDDRIWDGFGYGCLYV